MKLIIDTQVFLWFMAEDERLSETAIDYYVDTNVELILSIASPWEMSIKSSMGKLSLPESIDQYVSSRCKSESIRMLRIELKHLSILESLPYHHRDPFDRLIICQAISENLPVLSYDPLFGKYDIELFW